MNTQPLYETEKIRKLISEYNHLGAEKYFSKYEELYRWNNTINGRDRHFIEDLANGLSAPVQSVMRVLEQSLFGKSDTPSNRHQRIFQQTELKNYFKIVKQAKTGLEKSTSRSSRIEKKQKYETSGWFRNSAVALEVKEAADFKCQACNFDFQQAYGALGNGYLEAHHIEPLALKKEEVSAVGADDLLALCANCHRMIHRLIARSGKPSRAVPLDELKSYIQAEKP